MPASLGNFPVIDHDKDITASETWDGSHIHHVKASLNVFSNAVLTISPGATVSFDEGTGLVVGDGTVGTLKAEGTSAAPITLTSNNVDPQPGAWVGIAIDSGRASVLSNIRMSWAGQDDGAALRVNGSAGLALKDCRIEQAKGNGVRFGESAEVVNFARNVLTGNGGHPIDLFPNHVGKLDGKGTTYTGNGRDQIALNGGTVTASATWQDPGVPILVVSDGHSGFDVRNPAVLTVDKGLLLKMSQGTGIWAGGDNSSLLVKGTAESPVVFESAAELPSKGDWRGVTVDAGRSHSLDHLIVRHAADQALYVANGAGVAITNSRFEKSVGNGVTVDAGQTSGGILSNFKSNVMTDNGGYPISLSRDEVARLDATSTYTGNGTDRVYVPGGDLSVASTWNKIGVPYMSEWIYLAKALTLSAGVHVLMTQDSYITKYTVDGILVTQGTSEDPVVIESAAAIPSQGDWRGVSFSGTGVSRLSYTRISHAGAGQAYGGVYVGEYAKLDLVGVNSFTDSGTWGVYRFVDCGGGGASGTITPAQAAGSTFSNNKIGDYGEDSCN